MVFKTDYISLEFFLIVQNHIKTYPFKQRLGTRSNSRKLIASMKPNSVKSRCPVLW